MKQTCIVVCSKCVVSIKMCNEKHHIKDVINAEMIDYQRYKDCCKTI